MSIFLVSAMEDKKEVIVSGLRGLCNETNNKVSSASALYLLSSFPVSPTDLNHSPYSNQVKKVFAQVIIAMAHHGYLELEGGHHMVEFIVRQCSLEDEPKVRGVTKICKAFDVEAFLCNSEICFRKSEQQQ